MRPHSDEVEMVVTAKIDDDFDRAIAAGALGAAKARFGHTTATRLGALPGYPAYNKARGFSHEDLAYLPAICGFFTDVGSSPLIEVWAGRAGRAPGQSRLLRGRGQRHATYDRLRLLDPRP